MAQTRDPDPWPRPVTQTRDPDPLDPEPSVTDLDLVEVAGDVTAWRVVSYGRVALVGPELGLVGQLLGGPLAGLQVVGAVDGRVETGQQVLPEGMDMLKQGSRSYRREGWTC